MRRLAPMTGLEPFLGPQQDPPPASRQRHFTAADSAEELSGWARTAAVELGAARYPFALDRAGSLAYGLTDDVLKHGIEPMTLQVTVSAASIDVAVSGGRSVAQRSVEQNAPRVADVKRHADAWKIRTGPGGRGSTLTASVSLLKAGRLRRRLLLALPGRRR